jgi:hypothetical protein
MASRVSYYVTHEDQLVVVRPGETPPADGVQMIPLDTLRKLGVEINKKAGELFRREADHYGYKEQAGALHSVVERIDELLNESATSHQIPGSN